MARTAPAGQPHPPQQRHPGQEGGAGTLPWDPVLGPALPLQGLRAGTEVTAQLDAASENEGGWTCSIFRNPGAGPGESWGPGPQAACLLSPSVSAGCQHQSSGTPELWQLWDRHTHFAALSGRDSGCGPPASTALTHSRHRGRSHVTSRNVANILVPYYSDSL